MEQYNVRLRDLDTKKIGAEGFGELRFEELKENRKEW